VCKPMAGFRYSAWVSDEQGFGGLIGRLGGFLGRVCLEGFFAGQGCVHCQGLFHATALVACVQ
jgi:hypothetical protein